MLAALGIAAASTSLAAGLWWADRLANELPRVAVGGTLDTIEQIDGAPVSTQPRNFLVVGADSTSTLPADDPLRAGRSDAQLLTDTLMIVRIDPQRESVSLLSLPRDLWVRVSPGGYETKINAVLALGGSGALIETIQDTFGIPINHYVEADFNGFRGVVDAVDGVPVYFPFPMRDAGTGFVQVEPGCATLDADAALAYVRSRRMEGLVDGLTWTKLDAVPDFGRISRQQGFVQDALERAIAKGGLRHPATSLALVDSAIDSVTLDDVISRGELLDLMNQFQAFQARSLETFTVPSFFGFEGELSVLYVDEPAAAPILAPFRGDPAPAASDLNGDNANGLTPLEPTSLSELASLPAIDIRVLNGSGVASLDDDLLVALADAGMTVVAAVEPDAAAIAKTTIRHRRGMEAEAALVGAALGIDDFRANTALDVSLEITLGSDFEGFDGQVDTAAGTAAVAPPESEAEAAAPAESSTPSCV